MFFRKKQKDIYITVRTDSFSDIDYVKDQTKRMCDELKKINPDVRLNMEVDLRRN